MVKLGCFAGLEGLASKRQVDAAKLLKSSVHSWSIEPATVYLLMGQVLALA